MALFTKPERIFADAISHLAYANPFLPERIEAEKAALGPAFVAGAQPWNVHPDQALREENLVLLLERSEKLVTSLRDRLLKKPRISEADCSRYEDLVLFVLYHRFLPRFKDLISVSPAGLTVDHKQVSFYKEYADQANHLFTIPGIHFPGDRIPGVDVGHIFACFFQLRRAFDQIFTCIMGVSQPAVRLRAAVWQSIFTHDMRRYRRVLYSRMGDLTTLITGPSGTGKELVARAIGLSRYIPFDPRSKRFADNFVGSFQPLNLSALSPTLIESELFGHRKGAFTGAIADHVGWMESCPSSGTVFLDEIGDLDKSIQVKLLRVLHDRTFQRIGDTATRTFEGKIIAATNRDLTLAMRDGRFREDLYYRLCADTITTPFLSDRIQDNPEELHHLILHIARNLIEEDAPALAAEGEAWIENRLEADYAWPGNVRELEQCMRNILIRGEYNPPMQLRKNLNPQPGQNLGESGLTAEQMLTRYCTMVYAETGNYVEAARRLDLDRRTVRARIDYELLARLKMN